MSHTEYIYTNAQLTRQIREQSRIINSLNSIIRGMNNTVDALRRDNGGLRNDINNARTTINNLNRQVAAEAAATNALRRQLNENYENMQREILNLEHRNEENLNNLAQTIEREMAEQNAQLINTIETVQENLQGQIDQTNEAVSRQGEQIRTIQQQLEEQAQSDREFLEQAEVYFQNAQALIENYRPLRTDLVSQEMLTNVNTSFSNARHDLDAARAHIQAAPTALSSARAAYMSAFNAYHAVLIAQEEWNARLGIARQTAEYVERVLEQSAEINDDNYEGLDTNYWSFGQLAELRQRLQGINERIESADVDRLTREQVDGLTAELERIKEDLGNTVVPEALVNYNRALDMDEYANNVVEAFRNHGMLSIVADGYHYDEDRDAYMMHFRNANGLEISLELRPLGYGQEGYRVIYHLLNQGNQQNYQQLEQTLQNLLSSIGVAFQCERDAGGRPVNSGPSRPCTRADEQEYARQAAQINTSWKDPRPQPQAQPVLRPQA